MYGVNVHVRSLSSGDVKCGVDTAGASHCIYEGGEKYLTTIKYSKEVISGEGVIRMTCIKVYVTGM